MRRHGAAGAEALQSVDLRLGGKCRARGVDDVANESLKVCGISGDACVDDDIDDDDDTSRCAIAASAVGRSAALRIRQQ